LVGKELEFRIPGFFEDRVRDLVLLSPPCCDIFGEAEKFCDPGATI
jgi:hypothetical protein